MSDLRDIVSKEFLIAGSLFCAVAGFVLFLRSSSAHRRLRAVLVGFWASYLDSASATLRQLRSLRAILAQFRNVNKHKDLDLQASGLFEKVSSEIGVIEGELDVISRAPDSVWHSGEIQLRSMIPIAAELQNLLALAEHAMKKASETPLAPKPDPDMVAAMKQMESDLAALREELWKCEEEKKRTREFSEEAAAAKLMGALRDDLSLEDIGVRIAATNGEIADCRRRIQESSSDADEQKRLTDRQNWSLQVMRWWEILKKLRTKSAVTLEAEAPDAAELDRAEEAMEFQAVEAQNAELRRKLSDLQMTNRRLNKEIDELDASSATIEQLREVLSQVDIARKMSQRELANLEKMFDQLEAEVNPLRMKAGQLEKSKADAERLKNTLAAMEKENREQKKNLEFMQTEMDNAVDSLQQMMDKEIKQKQKAEEEALQLQKAFDEANAKLIQQKSARAQMEKSESQAKEELKNLKAEYQELQAKFRELRESAAMK